MITNWGTEITEEQKKKAAQALYDMTQKDEMTLKDILSIWKRHSVLAAGSKEDVIKFAKLHGAITE